MTTLEILKSAREILERSYIPFVRHDGRGGHCALGAIEIAGGYGEYKIAISPDSTGPEAGAVKILAKMGWPIYRTIPLPSGFLNGYYPVLRFTGSVYDSASVVATVNNIAGKGAILRVFDDAISALEVSELCQQVEKQGVESDGIPSDTRVPETVSR